jgi:hypothetical protein
VERRKAMMRLFKETSTYVYIFLAYALNALFLLLHSAKEPLASPKPPDLLVFIPMIVGMMAGAVMSFVSIRNTSIFVEKGVLILTGLLCLLFVISTLPRLGYGWAAFPFSRPLFIVISCVAAVLVGVRVLQLVRFSKDRSALI